MTTISWYETLEGKLAMCLAVLLVVAAVMMSRQQYAGENESRAQTPNAVINTEPKPGGINDLDELPTLNPYNLPEPIVPTSPAPTQPFMPATPLDLRDSSNRTKPHPVQPAPFRSTKPQTHNSRKDDKKPRKKTSLLNHLLR